MEEVSGGGGSVYSASILSIAMGYSGIYQASYGTDMILEKTKVPLTGISLHLYWEDLGSMGGGWVW